MNVTLFIPCYVDLCFPRVGISMVQILERLGHTVECPEGPACCGQPPYNAGYWGHSQEMAGRVIDQLRGAEVVVIPSGSCGTMLRMHYPELMAGTPHYEAAVELAPRCFEFSQFLVRQLGVTDVGARFPARVTFHDGCHGLRELDNRDPPRALMARVGGLELVEMGLNQTCCGFGGTFCADFPHISSAMGRTKCTSALETGAEYIVSNDSSCLMHLEGLLKREKKPLRTIHLAEVLAST